MDAERLRELRELLVCMYGHGPKMQEKIRLAALALIDAELAQADGVDVCVWERVNIFRMGCLPGARISVPNGPPEKCDCGKRVEVV